MSFFSDVWAPPKGEGVPSGFRDFLQSSGKPFKTLIHNKMNMIINMIYVSIMYIWNKNK